MKLFDSHFHIIDYHFPVKENNGYMPPSFKVNDNLNHTFQGFDQDYLISALNQLQG